MLVDGVAVEAAADLVVDPSVGHRRQCVPGHVARQAVAVHTVTSEEELDGLRLRELGRTAPAPGLPIVRAEESFRRGGRELGIDGLRRSGCQRVCLQRPGEIRSGFQDGLPPVAPGIGDALQHLPEGRQAMAGLGGPVGAAVERLALRREEDRERPAAGSGQADDGLHVDRVEVGPFLSIDLDVDEVRVHQGGDPAVLEQLVGHDVAPVTGGVADAEEDRLVFPSGAGQRVFTPRVPIDGVVGVLEEIGRGGGLQSVCHARPPSGLGWRSGW